MTIKTSKTASQSSRIKVLIADDSWVFRKILRDIFKRMQHIELIDDAANGIEALEQIIKFRPDVFLLDMEMPLMDGITTLQHLMIHTPTPTIVFSSLSQEGTARSFDALKYGAVDFVAKSSFFNGNDMAADKELLIKKVLQASTISVKSINPMQAISKKEVYGTHHLVFCEECGAKNVVERQVHSINDSVSCSHCGDEIKVTTDERYRRFSHVTVMGAGEGGYVNLLKIIPSLSADMNGAVVVLIHDEPENISSFVEYLASISSIKVVQGQDGVTVEGGSCYIFSGAERVIFSPYSGSYVFRITSDPLLLKQKAINSILVSLAPLLKERLTGVILSGSENDGIKGMEAVLQYQGNIISLDVDRCFSKDMNAKLIRRFPDTITCDEQGIIELIESLDRQNRRQVVMA